MREEGGTHCILSCVSTEGGARRKVGDAARPAEGDLLSQCREVAGSGPRWAAQEVSALGQAQAPQAPVLPGLCCSSTRKGPDEKQETQWCCRMTMKGAPRTQGWLAAWLEARPTVLPCEAAPAPGLAQRVGPARVRPRPSQPTPPFLASPPHPEILGTSLQAASGYRLETGGGYKQRWGGTKHAEPRTQQTTLEGQVALSTNTAGQVPLAGQQDQL